MTLFLRIKILDILIWTYQTIEAKGLTLPHFSISLLKFSDIFPLILSLKYHFIAF